MLVAPRTTCLYCEQKGVTQELKPWAHWMVCPVHSPTQYAAAVTTEELAFLAANGDKGRPRKPGA